MKEQTVEIAMGIIMAAGDARLLCKQALDAVADGNIDKARILHDESKNKIAEAHRLQTDVIQGEISGGEPLEYNSLFAHAQDTLMTIYSEINMTKHLIHICDGYERRLAQMEDSLKAMKDTTEREVGT